MIVGDRGAKKVGWVLFFLLPSLLGLLVFIAFPVISSLVLSFHEWDLLSPARFVGLENFKEIISSNDFWSALGHTLYFIAGYLPSVIAISLGVAVLLNQRLRGLSIYRAAFFVPVVSAWVAVALLWKWILNPRFGLLNYALALIGIEGPAWLFDPASAMPAVILTSVWKDTGFLTVMFLAGLQGIPTAYYEAASIDGANAWHRFWRVTLPLLSPTVFFAMVISLINSFQVFDQIWIMTSGGPAGATTVLVERIVKNAFSYSRMGYASALSWMLFLIIFGVTFVQMRAQKKWVVYD
jgi:multiple sugar transport system permease protein